MLTIDSPSQDIDALHLERFHHPHPRVQLKMEAVSLKRRGLAHRDIWRLARISENTQGRVHKTVDHSGPKSSRARDGDGDGVREVHCNTVEGTWTGLRNFLRPFRGVSKWYLDQYVAIFQWGHDVERVTDGFLRALLGMWPSTGSAT